MIGDDLDSSSVSIGSTGGCDDFNDGSGSSSVMIAGPDTSFVKIGSVVSGDEFDACSSVGGGCSSVTIAVGPDSSFMKIGSVGGGDGCDTIKSMCCKI